MKVIGIIAEYNPFHNGHLYQINQIKKEYPDSIIIVIVSNCFTQRGDISLLNKWDKTKIILNNNVDIVLELPFVFATQSADIFAKGAIAILKEFKIDILYFGSETNDVNKFKEMANISLHNKEYNNYVKQYLDKGFNYPTALSKAFNHFNFDIKSPNDLLALSYVKEIINQNTNIIAKSIKRTNDYHDKEINNDIINATLIRKLYLNNESIDNYVPDNVSTRMYQNSINDFFYLLKYQIINNFDNLQRFQTVDEGIENRIKKVIYKVNNWEQLVEKIKTKRYTYNKINRMLVHILTGFTKEEAKQLDINYLRLLGFNKLGKEYLNKIKKELSYPLITNYKPNISNILDIEFRINSIYSIVVDKDLIEDEFSHNPIIK